MVYRVEEGEELLEDHGGVCHDLYTYICLYISMYLSIHICIYMYVCLYIYIIYNEWMMYIYIYIYLHMYKYIYIYIYIDSTAPRRARSCSRITGESATISPPMIAVGTFLYLYAGCSSGRACQDNQ